LNNDINLFAYHLPLDVHPELGNNAQLAKLLHIQNPQPIGKTLVWQGEIDLSLGELAEKIKKTLNRKPLTWGQFTKKIQKITWCSGGAQDYIKHAIEAEADCFITGEVSEQTPAIAMENNLSFISAGHHATERYGVQALGKHLAEKFALDYQFIEIENLV
jgi:dinuclear metal center YbgI/SA1388 family protein